ncbi:hypothetical protein ACVWYF_002557 [Hymenobacter sp. UYAg731]
MKKNLLPALLSLLMVLGLAGPVRAATPPPTTGRPLAEALNPDGTLKAGLNGSFDARAFRMRTAPDGRPVFRPAGTAGAGDERWTDGFGLAGADKSVATLVRSGTDVYVGGGFGAVGNIKANGVAKWNGTAWSSLGVGTANGVNGTVYALAVAGNGDVYAGGDFSQAGGAAANRVARWNGTAWSSLGTGTANGVGMAGNAVYALAVAGNGDVYAGGLFQQAGGATANHVARWNGTAWSSLGTGTANGLNDRVMALVVAGNGDVYVGGFFTFINSGGQANRVARWDGTAWNSLGTGITNGVGDRVQALAVAGNGDVYVGGNFSYAGGVVASRVAKWNGTAWSGLGTGTSNVLNGPVNALALAGNGDIYAGGEFSQASGAAANRVARWNGTAWSSLSTGTGNGVNDVVKALAVAGNGDVYAGGLFQQAGGAAADYVAKWSGTAWSSLGTGNGLNFPVQALAVADNGDVYVGGDFTQAGGAAANYIARWNGTAWSSLGTGTANGVSGRIRALAVAGNGDVYAGGQFTQAGGAAANCIARWDGTAWSSLGTGTDNGVSGSQSVTAVTALAVAGNGDVYVGGDFTQAGGAAANYIAKWNGTAWSSLGTGTGGRGGSLAAVKALAVAGNGDVYVGGGFTQAGGVAANYIAKWDGTAWSSLGTGTDNTVMALAVAGNGDVYAGVSFIQTAGASVDYVAKWNGTAWSSLGTGLINGASGRVYALAMAGNGDVYAGGYFTQLGGVAANNVAKWNGTAWSGLGTGTNGFIYALATGPTGKLYAGGFFTATGDGSKLMARFGIYDPNAPLATTAAARTTPAALFPNPAHGTATLRLPAGAPRQPLTLTDALGRTVRRYPAPAAGSDAELDLRGLHAGTYVVRCGIISQRLVVE